jgi:acyl-CoA synthetase (AMP-forming)/AMP-acid ligase II
MCSRKWLTPEISPVSSRAPVRTKKPMETERADGLTSPMISRPTCCLNKSIRAHGVTHYCGAPIVHSLLINAPDAMKQGITHKVSGAVAAAAPPASMIEGMARIGFEITHVYGLTEVYGPAAVAVKRPEWAATTLSEQTRLNGRQGVRYALEEGMTVMEPTEMREVPRDGETMGEIMFRGNIVMKGYLKNEKATTESFAGGWFHTGDLAVLEADRYDIDGQQRMLRDMVRTGQTRAKVGENTFTVKNTGIAVHNMVRGFQVMQ